jgi:acetyl-CoA carboxylase biotin carboxyl carrier protein
MEMSQEVMKALLEAFERSDWEEMTVTVGNDRLALSRRAGADVSAPAATPAPASVSVDGAASNAAGASAPAPYKFAQPVHRDSDERAPEPREELPAGTVIESPSVGLFWRAPSPGAPPFTEIGRPVSEGDTLAIVEVMKLMNHVVAPVGGVVVAILPDNGEAVEHRQPLVVIDPES